MIEDEDAVGDIGDEGVAAFEALWGRAEFRAVITVRERLFFRRFPGFEDTDIVTGGDVAALRMLNVESCEAIDGVFEG